jgi:hypothetical protein
MNTHHQWIKYFGIAFGLVIALGVISLIINGGQFLMSSLGLIQPPIVSNDSSYYDFTEDYTNTVNNIDINLDACDLIIQPGDTLRIQGSNLSSSFSSKTNNNTLIIRDPGNLNFLNHSNKAQLILTLPPVTYHRITINLGVGTGNISDIISDELTISQGIGNISLSNSITMSGSLDGGVGSIYFNDVTLNNFSIDSGIGSVDIQGLVTGIMSIDCGIGQTILNLQGEQTNYYLDFDTGIGSIMINDHPITTSNNGPKDAQNIIKINGGIGSVAINFN